VQHGILGKVENKHGIFPEIVPIDQLVHHIIVGFERKYLRNSFYGTDLVLVQFSERRDFIDIMSGKYLIPHKAPSSVFPPHIVRAACQYMKKKGGLKRKEKRGRMIT
jgi:hypothetical protein